MVQLGRFSFLGVCFLRTLVSLETALKKERNPEPFGYLSFPYNRERERDRE